MSHYFRSCCRSHDSEDDELSLWPSRAASARKSKSLLLDESIAFVYYLFASSIPESKYIIAVRWWHGGGVLLPYWFLRWKLPYTSQSTRPFMYNIHMNIKHWWPWTYHELLISFWKWSKKGHSIYLLRNWSQRTTGKCLLRRKRQWQNFRGIFKQSGEQRQSGSLAYIIRRCSRWELKVL